jgi:hypothetical protein
MRTRSLLGAVLVLVCVAALTGCGTADHNSAAAADPDVPVDTTEAPPTTPPGPPMTSCKSIVHIGDSTSIGLTSASYLPKPAERIDAQYARVGVTTFRPEISGARSIVEHLKNQLNAEDVAKQVKATGYDGCWVLALGTTDAADIAAGSNHSEPERIDRMMAVIGDAPVLWVNVKTLKTKGDWANANMALFDKALIEAQARYPNIEVYDWASVVQDAWFTSDQIHYSTPGYAQRSKLIADALAAQIPA